MRPDGITAATEAAPQVRLRGEVHRLVAPRDQKYQSNFVEVCRPCYHTCIDRGVVPQDYGACVVDYSHVGRRGIAA